MAEWVVDGDNVVGSRPDGWWRDRAGAKRRLVERLAALSEAVFGVDAEQESLEDIAEPLSAEAAR